MNHDVCLICQYVHQAPLMTWSVMRSVTDCQLEAYWCSPYHAELQHNNNNSTKTTTTTRRNIHPLTHILIINHPLQLIPSTTIHSILPVKFTYLTVILHDLSKSSTVCLVVVPRLCNLLSSKSRLVLSFWCQLTCVVPDKIQAGHKMILCVCVYIDMTADISYSLTPNLCIAHFITSLGTLSKAFSKSNKAKIELSFNSKTLLHLSYSKNGTSASLTFHKSNLYIIYLNLCRILYSKILSTTFIACSNNLICL